MNIQDLLVDECPPRVRLFDIPASALVDPFSLKVSEQGLPRSSGAVRTGRSQRGLAPYVRPPQISQRPVQKHSLSPPPTPLSSGAGISLSSSSQGLASAAAKSLLQHHALSYHNIDKAILPYSSEYSPSPPRRSTRSCVTSRRHVSMATGSYCPPPLISTHVTTSSPIKLIPRPPGEVGRPNSGGYNLNAALGWEADMYDKVRRCMSTLVKTNLDGTLQFRDQPKEKISRIRKEVKEKHPIITGYQNDWPIMDFIKIQFKHFRQMRQREEKRRELEAACTYALSPSKAGKATN